MEKILKKPKVTFYIGFLIFLIGFSGFLLGLHVLGFLEIIGLQLAGFSIVRWLRQGALAEKFKREPGEDWLGFYLKKIILRIWEGIFFAWMVIGVLLFISRLIR